MKLFTTVLVVESSVAEVVQDFVHGESEGNIDDLF